MAPEAPPASARVEAFLAAKQAGDFLEAGLHLRRILDASPGELLKDDLMARALAYPVCFTRPGQLDEYFHYLDGLVSGVHDFALLQSDPALSARLAHGFMTGSNMRMAVHNEFNLKPFMKRRAALFDYALRAMGMLLGHAFSERPAGRRPRLGVLLKHLSRDPETISILPYFEHLDPERFDRYVIALAEGEGEFAAHLRGLGQTVILPRDLPGAAKAIRELDLDFLIFGGDITAKPSPMALLSFFRLARRSLTAVCTLVTTGGAQVDHYLTGSYYQARGFDQEFTETCLPAGLLGFAFSFGAGGGRPASAPPARSALSQPNRVTLVSGANFTKLNADLLQSWGRILAACPEARLVLYPFPAHYALSQRAEVVRHIMTQIVAGGGAAGQVDILPTIPNREMVVELTAGADLALDSFPYPGVTTAMDHMEAGLPMVALEGARLRTSQSAAMLRSLGLDATLVRDRSSYEALAVELVRDASRRQFLREAVQTAFTEGVPEMMDARAMGRRMDRLLTGLIG